MEHKALSENLDYYLANQQELFKKYPDRVLLIKDQKVLASYYNYSEAYSAAIKDFELGTFSLQKCTKGPEGHTVYIY